jgi:hypothetical protein
MVRKLLKKLFKFKEEEDIQEELFAKPVYVYEEEPIIDES